MSNLLTIGELVRRTGGAEPTPRMWERRHGFPMPARTPSGHRRYTATQVDQIPRVVAGRAAGLSLTAAIERATHGSAPEHLSLFATVRRSLPELQPRSLGKSAMLAFSHAIEDESLARADPRVLFGCFQRERFYRQAQRRWQELSEGAVAAAFADFDAAADPILGAAEIPIKTFPALSREWSLVCYGERSAICLAGREPASSNTQATRARRSFEALWTVEPTVVRDIARACAEAASAHVPAFADRTAQILALEPAAGPEERLRLATAVIDRTLSLLP